MMKRKLLSKMDGGQKEKQKVVSQKSLMNLNLKFLNLIM
jgi:hypothetical protein